MKRISTFLLLFSCYWSFSQNCYIDSNKAVKTSNEEVQQYFANKKSLRLDATIRYVPLKIYSVIDTLGNTIDLASFNKDFIELNKAFLPINVQFYLCSSISYIKNDRLYDLSSDEESNALTSNYQEQGKINVYYVGDISYKNACGLASIGPQSRGFVFVASACGAITLIHEMGHYFNLYHPHDAYNGNLEKVDESNCTTAGDLICDTPAEPKLSGKVDNNCVYIGTDLDPNKVPYKPNTDNFMSYAPSNCTNKFTAQQYQRMQYYFENTLINNVNCTMKTDLTCTLSDPTNKLAPGTSYPIRLAVTNSSFVPYSGSVGYTLYLKDNVGNQYPITTSSKNVSLSANSTDTIVVNVNITSAYPEGIYTINAQVDPQNLISESVENNNTASANVGIFSSTTQIADLELKIQGPSTHYAGYEYVIDFTCQNIGNKDAGNFSLDFYISQDQVPSNDDIFYGGGYGTLAIGEITISSDALTMPTQVDVPIYIIAIASLSTLEKESNYENNRKIIKVVNVLPPSKLNKVDLVFTGSSVTSGKQVKQLAQIGGTFDYINTGDTSVTQFPMNLYLSKDSLLSSDDALLNSTFTRMYNYEGIWNSIYGDIPPQTPVGAYYLIAYLDPYNYVLEKNENNNSYSVPIKIIAGDAADYIISDPILSDTIWLYGQSWNFKATITNQGLGDDGSVLMYYYLQQDLSEFAKPPFVHSVSSYSADAIANPIPVGTSYKEYYTEGIDSNTDPGIYYFAACVSSYGSEYDDNNCWVYTKPIKVLAQPLGVEKGNDMEKINFTLYPNPVVDKLHVDNFSEIKRIVLYSTEGKGREMVLQNGIIDMTEFPNGMYQLVLYTQNSAFTKSFIKQ